MVNGYQVSHAIHAAVTLGIPDRLGQSSAPVTELAAATGSQEEALYRLLRALASVGVIEEQPNRRFALTELGEGLRSDVPDTLAGWAELIGRPYYQAAWPRLVEGVRTGGHPFRLEHGVSPWEYRASRPDEVAIFNRAMNSLSSQVADAVLAAYDFSPLGLVVDVGGGGGFLLAAILQRHRALKGVLFDLEGTIEAARAYVASSGVADRCKLVAGDFFESAPGHADAYLLKAVLHDWYDPEATRILKTIRAAGRDDSLLLIIEQIIEPPNQGPEGKFSDLNMLVAAGGRERTRAEWDELLRAGGFELRRVHPARSVAVLEAAAI